MRSKFSGNAVEQFCHQDNSRMSRKEEASIGIDLNGGQQLKTLLFVDSDSDDSFFCLLSFY